MEITPMSLAQLWLPVVVSALAVFFASSLFNMLLRAWHGPDYRGLANEDEVRAALRRGASRPGLYQLPYCTHPVAGQGYNLALRDVWALAQVLLRADGAMNLGVYLAQWFGYCLLVAACVAYLGAHTLAAGAPFAQVLRVTGTAALLAFSLGNVPNAIWWAHPWASVAKYAVDGAIYAVLTGLVFAWLWPAA